MPFTGFISYTCPNCQMKLKLTKGMKDIKCCECGKQEVFSTKMNEFVEDTLGKE